MFVHSFIEGLPQTTDGLVELLPTDKVVLAFDHGESGHDALFEDEEFGFEFVFVGVDFGFECAGGVTEFPYFSVHLAEFMRVTEGSSRAGAH